MAVSPTRLIEPKPAILQDEDKEACSVTILVTSATLACMYYETNALSIRREYHYELIIVPGK